MWAAHQTTKIIHLCLQTVKSGSNKGSLPIDPIHGGSHCQLSPLEGPLAQARSGSVRTVAPVCLVWGNIMNEPGRLLLFGLCKLLQMIHCLKEGFK